MDGLAGGDVTRREREVLTLLGGRLTNAEIAAHLCISVRTVESHVSALLRKLEAADRRALALVAERDASAAPEVRQGGATAGDDAPGEPSWHAVLGALRRARGLTQAQWAARVGVSRRTVQRWERGETPPDAAAEAQLLAAAEQGGTWAAFEVSADTPITPAVLSAVLAGARLGATARLGAAAGRDGAAVHLGGSWGSSDHGGDPPTNLPAPLSSFVGRDREIGAVRGLLGTARLVTLTGPGGGGKTRLGLEAAGELRWAFADGVWLVELAALSDATVLPHAVAAALGVRVAGGAAPAEALVDALRDRHLLVVLDNCEHLVAPVALLAEALLRSCPRLHVLATSREVLSVPGEVAWPVPPLSLPVAAPDGPDGTLGGHQYGPEWWARESDAVRLFVERARQHRPSFELTALNVAAVVDVCCRLDGIPLAIELAAARVRTLGVDDIAARLQDRFRLLTTGDRTAVPRHRTLRAAIDWSHALLAPPEKALLRRLAVFAGGFTLGAVEALTDEASPADVLDSLVAKSLVIAEDRGGTVRYRMLETLRQYAQERLVEAGEDAAARERHCAWYRGLAEAAAPHLRGADQRAWLERLACEHDNLRAALAWSTAGADGATALRLAGALWWFWHLRGHAAEGRRRLEQALARAVGAPAQLRAEALRGLGILAHGEGDYARAAAAFDDALVLYREDQDRLGVAKALNNVGMIAWEQGRYDRAQAIWRECLTLYRDFEDRRGIAIALNNLGLIAREQGRYPRAIELWQECLAAYRALGDEQGIASALANLGQVCAEQDDYARADDLYAQSLALRRALGHRHGIAIVLALQAAADAVRGEFARAEETLDEGLQIAREIGDRQRIAYALCGQADTAAFQGDLTRAVALQREARELFGALGERLGMATASLGLAWAAVRLGDVGQAEAACEDSHAMYHQMDHRKGAAWTQHVLAAAARRRGDDAGALALEEDALATMRAMGCPRGVACCLEGLAVSAGMVGQPEVAVRLWAAAAAARQAIGAPVPPVDRTGQDHDQAAVRLAIGDDAFLSAWSAGLTAPLDRVLGVARQWTDALGDPATSRRVPRRSRVR